MTLNARHVATAVLEGAELDALLAKLAKLNEAQYQAARPANLTALREDIASQIVELGGYTLPV